jgi:hypothetical protein
MKTNNCFSRLPNEEDPRGRNHPAPASIGIALLLLMSSFAIAQDTTTPAAAPGSNVQQGFVVRQSADLGGHVVGVTGSGAMYDTLVNIQSGPRVLGETFQLHAVPGSKHALLDSLTAFSNGFGGDPINFAKLDFSKGRLYEFSGTFRRDRQYFDYDLLGNPSVPGNLSIPIGPSNAPTGSLAFPQVTVSPVMFNTVRRMTDTYLTIFPRSKVTFRVGYSQNIFQGPTLSPGRSIGKNDSLLAEYQRNSTDDFLGAMDWKPVAGTVITFEETVDHYKGDSYFTLAPSELLVQEADGTPASIGNWDATASPYPVTSCNTASMGSAYTSATVYTILTANSTAGGRPIINAACDVITSYLRSQPTRALLPTEQVRFVSNSLKKLETNGDFRYTIANSTLTNFYENFQGLDGAIRSATFTGGGSVQRRVTSGDFGVTYQLNSKWAFSDQFNYSNTHQPGQTNISPGVTQNTPTTAGNETINYNGPLVAGAAYSVSGNPAGVTQYGYFGQRFETNNATVTWDASPHATLSLTYRYQNHDIAQNANSGTSELFVAISENGGILNVALRPTNNWNVNGTAEVLYNDNVLTPMGFRQSQHYRVHSLYRPKPWATVTAAFNDVERHNNTNNTGTTSADGPLQHVDYSRGVSAGVDLSPNDHFGFNASYSYTEVYISTNVCYLSGATTALPGTAETNAAGAPNLCPDKLTDWGPVKDFMDAPTQYASAGITYTPKKAVQTGLGYRLSSVSGNQFFADAQQVNGSLQSAYQSPYLNVAWTVHPGWVWRADYNFYGYGEGGPSGAPYCSTSTSATAVIVPCNSTTLTGPTGLTEPSSGLSAPRNFHANLLTLSMHYEF